MDRAEAPFQHAALIRREGKRLAFLVTLDNAVNEAQRGRWWAYIDASCFPKFLLTLSHPWGVQ